MLEELLVHGVGGIKETKLDFCGNFIVITGESGSGKSSLVRALEFITGKRAASTMIHTQEDSCDVTVELSSCADNNDIEEEYCPCNGSLIARRVFGRNGRGKCSLQGVPAPLSTLLLSMEKELVIQSQFAQLGLLEPSKQLELVDSCGGPKLKELQDELSSTLHETIAIEKNIVAIKKRRDEVQNTYQNAEETIRLIRALELSQDSETSWNTELKELDSKYDNSEAIKTAIQKFLGAADGNGFLEDMETISKALYSLVPVSEDSDWHRNIENMLSSAQEISKKLRELQIENSSENIEETRERLEKKIGVVRKLKRILGLSTCTALIEYADTAEKEIKWLKESHKEIEEQEIQSSERRKKISSLAVELRALRKKSSEDLAASVNKHLKDMAMEYAVFGIDVEELDRVRANGAENVSFTLSIQGQQPLAVGKTASGGELSRILIAIQLSVGDQKLPGTLVFDEVEAGLGGKTALLAGYKLRELSERCRTILITHEATIAAMADQHFLVKRISDDTLISEVNGEVRAREIARMLSGDESSREALEHARSLLVTASDKNNGGKCGVY